MLPEDFDRPVPLRIGLLNENLSGHATFHRQLVQAIEHDQRFCATVVDAPPRGLLRRGLTNPLPLPDGWDIDLALFRNQVGQSAATRRIVAELVDSSDLVHLYTQNVSPLNLSLLRQRPYVVTSDATCRQTSLKLPFRNPGRGTETGARLSSWVERRLLREATAVVAQSEWARAGFIREAGVPEERVTVVRLGAPLPGPDIERPTRDVVRVIFVGATMTRKGGYLLLDALADRLGHGVELHLVTMEAVPPRPGLIVHNEVRPGDGRVAELLRAADIFALPSDTDMSPNAVLEAMAEGLPVVALDSGAVGEMVIDRQSGFLLPVGDARSLREALNTLIADAELRHRLGRGGRTVLHEKFDPATEAERFMTLLADAARTGAPGLPGAVRSGPGRWADRRRNQ